LLLSGGGRSEALPPARVSPAKCQLSTTPSVLRRFSPVCLSIHSSCSSRPSSRIGLPLWKHFTSVSADGPQHRQSVKVTASCFVPLLSFHARFTAMPKSTTGVPDGV
jgi:hypothetical protein